MIDTRIGTYVITIDDEGVKIADADKGRMTFDYNDALALAHFILAHRADIETMQQYRQKDGENIGIPPATEPE